MALVHGRPQFFLCQRAVASSATMADKAVLGDAGKPVSESMMPVCSRPGLGPDGAHDEPLRLSMR